MCYAVWIYLESKIKNSFKSFLLLDSPNPIDLLMLVAVRYYLFRSFFNTMHYFFCCQTSSHKYLIIISEAKTTFAINYCSAAS